MKYLALSILILGALQASNCGATKAQSHKTLLISAVKKGALEKVRECLRQGIDPNTKDEHGNTALHWACYLDKKGLIVKDLLNTGAKIDHQDRGGWISFDWAKEASNLSAIKLLIQKAIGLKDLAIQGYDERTLLHYAAALDDAEAEKIVGQLIALGLDPKARDRNDHTPLDYAKKKGVIIKLYLATNNPIASKL